MSIINKTGAQTVTETWDLVTDEYHVTGNVTLNAGVVITLAATGGSAVSPPILRFDGNFNMASATSGRFTTTGSSATNRIRFQPNGSATTWSAVNTSMFISHTSTGHPTFSFCDFFFIGLTDSHTAGNASITNCRWYVGRSTTTVLNVTSAMTAGTNTYQYLESYGNAGSNFNFSMGGGANTVDSIYARGCNVGVNWSPAAGTNTLTNVKAVQCETGMSVTGSTVGTFANLASLNCDTGASFAVTGSPTITRLIAFMEGNTNTIRVTTTQASGRVHTFDECYIGGASGGINNAGTTVADVIVQNSVLSFSGRFTRPSSLDGFLRCASSFNDVVFPSSPLGTNTGMRSGTSDNDYLAASNGAFVGATTMPEPGPTSDWADSTFSVNVDADSGNTTSTSTPVQYRTLTAPRTNPIATPHKPTTISGLAVSAITSSGATFDFTTGIRARSRILLSQSSGITQLNASTKTPWKYGGILDPDDPSDFTLPVTTHQHVLADLKFNTTYYYRVECVDPCGRHFLSTEANFITAGAGGGGAFGSALKTGGGL